MMRINIYTDGSIKGGNPGGFGGWAAILEVDGKPDTEKTVTGSAVNTTNHRMELMAAIGGIESLTRPCNVHVITDSKYVQGHVLRRWGVKANADLVSRLIRAMRGHAITCEWVKGHNGHPQNERCDELASDAALALKEATGNIMDKVTVHQAVITHQQLSPDGYISLAMGTNFDEVKAEAERVIQTLRQKHPKKRDLINNGRIDYVSYEVSK